MKSFFPFVASLWLLLSTSTLFGQTMTPEMLQQKIAEKEMAKYLPGNTVFNKTAITGPEQDCPSAIPVCQNIFVQPNSYTGFGTQEVPTSSCLGVRERNSVWYILTIQAGGNLAFTINPVNSSDDYDFALYNLTGKNCSDIVTGAAPEVRCNFSATAGVTGLTSAGTNASEPASGSKFSTILPVTTGQTYVLVIDNYSQSQSGYTLDFSTSTATIFDNVPPMPLSTITPCGVGTMTLKMSEAILCSTIAANGTDFLLTGPGGPFTITSASGILCGTQTSQITINFTPALTIGGAYTLTVKNGTDGNTLRDLCNNLTPVNTTLNFTAVAPPASISGPTSVCKNSPFTLTASPGTTYSWTKSPSPTVIGTGQTLTITPTTTGTSTYNVNVVSGTCNQNASISVTVKDAPTANFSFLPVNPVPCGTPVNFTSTSTLLTSCNGLGVVACGFACTLIGGSCQGNSLTSYLWSWGDVSLPAFGFGSSNTQTHTYSAPGTYTVTLSVTDPITNCANTFSTNVIVACGLPIEQLDFRANVQPNNTVSTLWKTHNLPEVTHFEVEKSLDGTSFENIEAVSVNAQETYQFIDQKPGKYNQPILYRLKVVSRDGSFVYSEAKEVTITPTENLVWVYPNPINTQESWNLGVFAQENTNATIKVYSTLGQLVFEENQAIVAGNQQLVMPSLSHTGAYIVQVQVGKTLKTLALLVK